MRKAFCALLLSCLLLLGCLVMSNTEAVAATPDPTPALTPVPTDTPVPPQPIEKHTIEKLKDSISEAHQDLDKITEKVEQLVHDMARMSRSE